MKMCAEFEPVRSMNLLEFGQTYYNHMHQGHRAAGTASSELEQVCMGVYGCVWVCVCACAHRAAGKASSELEQVCVYVCVRARVCAYVWSRV